jgi:hypothetical protein
MRRHPFLASLAFTAVLTAGHATAQTVQPANHHHRQPVHVVPSQPCLPVVPTPHAPPDPKVPPDRPPDAPPPEAPAPPMTDAFAQGPPAGGGETVGFNPAMFGDIVGGPSLLTTVRLPGGATVAARIPVVSRGGFKIADNESPRPTDRIFFLYNYYDRVDTSFNGNSNPPFNLHRQTIGFEKTFLEGNGSFGLRLPFLQIDNGFGDLDDSEIGDLTFIIKWAFLNDCMTGNVISGGLCVTAPTGSSFIGINGERIQSTLFQPWGGFVWNFGNAYVQGYSAMVFPTDSNDVTLWFNDIGIGYYLMRNDGRDRFLTAVVPTVEAHLSTPLSDRDVVPDWLTLTAGVNFVFGGNSTLGCAMGIPVTGPRPFDVEALVSFNLRF